MLRQTTSREFNRLTSELARLKAVVADLARDEVNLAVTKKLEKRSAVLDRGKGKKINSLKSFHSYLRKL